MGCLAIERKLREEPMSPWWISRFRERPVSIFMEEREMYRLRTVVSIRISQQKQYDKVSVPHQILIKCHHFTFDYCLSVFQPSLPVLISNLPVTPPCPCSIIIIMFRSFLRLFGPRQLGLFAGFSLLRLTPLFMTSEENERINQKLKRKLNEKYHNRKDISFELTEEYRKNMVIFTGNSNEALAKEIAEILKIDLGSIKVGRFNDGEVSIQVKDNVRSKDVFIIQSTSPPVNENLMELLLMVSTMRRASAKKINVVIPYYGYARQDRKTAPRVPISAADVARLLETVGVDRVILVDVHSGQIQGFFGPRVPVDNLEANLVALNYFVEQKKIPLRDIVVVSPDAGGVTRAKNFQALLSSVGVKETSLAMIIKQRKAAGEIGTMHLVGSVEGKQAIIIDDIIDTAGTLVEATKVLKEKGALSVSCFATHGLFTGKALQNVRNSQLDQVIVTNSIPPKDNEETAKIIRLSLAPILAEAIFRIQTKTSISSLFSIPKT